MENNFKNLSKVELMSDGSYMCTLEYYDNWYKTWETIPYVYNTNANLTPAGSWIKEQLNANTVVITEYVVPIKQFNTSI
jgi:hypothetical protein